MLCGRDAEQNIKDCFQDMAEEMSTSNWVVGSILVEVHAIRFENHWYFFASLLVASIKAALLVLLVSALHGQAEFCYFRIT